MIKLSRSEKLLKAYLLSPILIDFIIVIVAAIFETFISNFMISRNMGLWFIISKSFNSGDIFASIISTIVALSGFMVAALTIMITVKASLKARGYNDSDNALDYLFTTSVYTQIVKVFSQAIIEFVILLIVAYLSWICLPNSQPVVLFKIICLIVFAMSATIMRSVYIFFRVLSLENKKKEGVKTENENKQVVLLEKILQILSEKHS